MPLRDGCVFCVSCEHPIQYGQYKKSLKQLFISKTLVNENFSCWNVDRKGIIFREIGPIAWQWAETSGICPLRGHGFTGEVPSCGEHVPTFQPRLSSVQPAALTGQLFAMWDYGAGGKMGSLVIWSGQLCLPWEVLVSNHSPSSVTCCGGAQAAIWLDRDCGGG